MTCIQNPTRIQVIQNTVVNCGPAPANEPKINSSLISEIVRGLSRLERGSTSRCGSPLPPSFEPSHCPEMAQGQAGMAADETARVWGDPHFEDPDGGKFDLQGEAGKTYNLLSDQGIQLNGTFGEYSGDKNVVAESGLTLGGLRGVSRLQFNKEGQATLDGKQITPGSMETLADGGHAHLSEDGKTLTVKTGEGYTVTQTAKEDGLDVRVKSPRQGVFTDGRMPGGLMGQMFDGDKLARNSNGSQGEGAIAGKVQDYEVAGGLFGTPSSLPLATMAHSVTPSYSPENAPAGVFSGIYSSMQNGQPVTFEGNIQPTPQFLSRMQNLFQKMGLPLSPSVPGLATEAGVPMNGTQTEGFTSDSLPPPGEQTLDFLMGQANRQNQFQQIQEANDQGDQLLALLMTALQSGNIDQAMLLFSAMESKQAGQLTQALTQKLVQAQQNRRNLTAQLTQNQNPNGQGQMAQVQAGVQEVNDTIQLLTSFIKDVNEQKNRTIEFSNNFISNEHQTTMSIVRGMRA
ncbi:MAG: hypothetical protein U1F57_06025 [bacterium]